MPKPTFPFAETRAAAICCYAEHAGFPSRDTMYTMRRAEKQMADTATTPGEIREALTTLRRHQADKPTATRAALLGGLYMRLAVAVEAAIQAEREALHAAEEDAEAERADMDAKAARLRELTNPTPTPPEPTRTLMVCVDANEGRIVAQVTRTGVCDLQHGYDILPRTIDGEPCDPNTEFLDGTIDALTEAFDEEATRLDSLGWVPEPAPTPPAPTVPHTPTLDELTGAIKEAAEHGDWRAIHAYALELATLAVTNI